MITSKTIGTEKIAIADWPKVLTYVNGLPKPPRRELYFGKPGSGKTTLACSLLAE
jgi:hypothetical protein